MYAEVAGAAEHTISGGEGGRLIIAGLGAVLTLLLSVMAFLGPILYGEAVGDVLISAVPAGVAGLVGVVVGWLAWWGAVEPLPARAEMPAEAQAVKEQEA